MTESVQFTKKQDDVLADFTNHILDGKPLPARASDLSEALGGLEETILRLNRAFPPQALAEKTMKRMQLDFKIRRQRTAPPARPAFWWPQQTLQRLVLALAVIVVIAVLVIISLFVSGSGGLQASAGLHPQSIVLSVFLIGGVLLLAFWLGRRK
ncbi:MAG TPA: hypothetical protein VLZ89_01600 [Anaerolineales bacterium]|nr:hypothetical protein [Anaerolineales bacterium]